MNMTEKEFRNEYLYNSTMLQIGRMLEMGLITDADYCQISTKMRAKYLPASGGLVSEVWRINRAKRALMAVAAEKNPPAGKEAIWQD